MATVSKLGPADHDRPMTLDEFMTGDYEEGYKYELIDGRLYVAPQPNLPEARTERWIFGKLWRYSDEHPGITNYVYNKSRVFIPGRRRTTSPEPDVTAYRDFPLHLPVRQVRWQDLRPILTVEILSADDPDKDLVRNVELYFQVPTIREYWVFDPRDDPERPSLRVYRRHGRRWRIIEVGPGETYTTKLLPGFALTLDLRT